MSKQEYMLYQVRVPLPTDLRARQKVISAYMPAFDACDGVLAKMKDNKIAATLTEHWTQADGVEVPAVATNKAKRTRTPKPAPLGGETGTQAAERGEGEGSQP